jgi:hypothetical protein
MTIAIPTYYKDSRTLDKLDLLFKSISAQKGVDFSVLVSDNSELDHIENLCARYGFGHTYCDDKGTAANTNALLDQLDGKIKIMYQDDLFLTDTALKDFSDALDNYKWVASTSTLIDERGLPMWNVHPSFTHRLLHENKIGMPSVVGLWGTDVRMDERLRTLLDTDFYNKLVKKYGLPYIIQKPIIGQRVWSGSVSATLDSNARLSDLAILASDFS